MKKSDIFEKIKKQVKELTGSEDDIKETSLLKEDLGLDSLSVVSLIAMLEESCKITFDDSDLDPEKLIDIKSLIELTEKTV